MTWYELMTQTGLGTTLCMGMLCLAALAVVITWEDR